MTELLNQFDPITLEQMSDIRLMNRTDTKFVTTMPMLMRLLEMAQGEYYAQETEGERLSPYYTLYFDTVDCDMYVRHETGHANRQKLRIRSYVNSGMDFLEVKTKNNHGRTKKKRVRVEEPEALLVPVGGSGDSVSVQLAAYHDFLADNLRYDPARLTRQIENRFDRITLVNKAKTERLTIDINLRFHNLVTDARRVMEPLVIIELKRDGRVPSPILAMLRELRIKPHGFSKYCIGQALTNPNLRRNRFKLRLHDIEKLVYSSNI